MDRSLVVVQLVKANWNQAFLDEIALFPAAAHVDQVDALADALNALASEYIPNLAAWA